MQNALISLLNSEKIHIASHDFRNFFYLCSKHRVCGQVQLLLQKEPEINQSLLQFFKTRRKPLQLQALQQFAALQELINSATNEKKAIILLKGIGLSHQLYQEPTLRHSCDIDILISQQDLMWFHALLKNRGFLPMDIAHIPKSYQNLIFKIYNHLFYYHPQKNISIELHWKFTPDNQFDQLDYDKILFSEKKHVLIGQFALPILPDHLNFLFLAFHAEKHYGSQLHWLYDTLQFAHRIPLSQWNEIQEMAREYKIDLHLNALFYRWKTFLPNLTQNIPFPVQRKIFFYPANQDTFYKKKTILLHLKHFFGRLMIIHSWIQRGKTLGFFFYSLYLHRCVKRGMPAAFFYLCLPYFFIDYCFRKMFGIFISSSKTSA